MGRGVIRELRGGDLGAIARIWRELRPDAMHSEHGLQHLLASFPERAQRGSWVAEDGGVVGWAFAHRRWHRATDNGYVWLGVLAEARGRELGSALWEAAEGHLNEIGVARVNAYVAGDEDGERFLERRGFEQIRTVLICRRPAASGSGEAGPAAGGRRARRLPPRSVCRGRCRRALRAGAGAERRRAGRGRAAAAQLRRVAR
jgi:GNAT superfamily N-acetyltransferase